MPRKPSRIYVDVIIDEIDLLDLEGPLEDAIEIFQALQEKVQEYRLVRLVDDSFGEPIRLAVRGERLENDKEYETRCRNRARALEAEKQRKEDNEKRDRDEYERLKKKYG